MIRNILVILLLSLMAFKPAPRQVTVYMIGDSTMSIKDKKAYPETGWGMPFANYFDTTITVDNRAKNGRSTRTFITEGLWQPVADGMKAGDYLMIQFGHNDEVPTKKSFTTEDEFRKNLNLFIITAKNKEALPVLITPVARRKFDSTGHVMQTHAVYAQIVRDVAKQAKVPLIDLDIKSQSLLQKLGPENSKFLYNHLEPGENSHYPKGNQDDTHFSELGARRMAELVMQSLQELNLELATHITKARS